mmetsp:Transcript_9239/g.13882  ORF Transcript_9239/g.13882 Transcript_9239/m.13882 type:complete len:137 (-) Transcript_9239:184-594(-)
MGSFSSTEGCDACGERKDNSDVEAKSVTVVEETESQDVLVEFKKQMSERSSRSATKSSFGKLTTANNSAESYRRSSAISQGSVISDETTPLKNGSLRNLRNYRQGSSMKQSNRLTKLDSLVEVPEPPKQGKQQANQ